MICFSGVTDNLSRKFLFKKMIKRICKLFSTMFIFLGVPSIFIVVYFQIYDFLIISILTSICPFLILLLSHKEYYPTRITIDGEEIQIESRANCRICNIEEVQKVLDYGSFFDIKIYSPTRIFNCICQKDLIVEGTIEEFEKLFEDKIVLKN